MPLCAGKYAICAFLQNMLNMLRSHDRYKPVSLTYVQSSNCRSAVLTSWHIMWWKSVTHYQKLHAKFFSHWGDQQNFSQGQNNWHEIQRSIIPGIQLVKFQLQIYRVFYFVEYSIIWWKSVNPTLWSSNPSQLVIIIIIIIRHAPSVRSSACCQ